MSNPSDAELMEAVFEGLAELERELCTTGEREPLIPEGQTFRQWCVALGTRGLKIDGKPFSLDNRPALIPIYDAIPSTREEAFQKILVVQKATQLGLTVWEVLANIYMAAKWMPVSIGMFMPDMSTAQFKSEHRFMRIVRSAPEVYNLLLARPTDVSTRKPTEGNVMTRTLLDSLLMFLWTSGKVTTESRPMDVVTLDEVQEMQLDQIDKVMARMGDSDVQFSLLLSTANLPDMDINNWFKRGTQEVWNTRCPTCSTLSDLSDPNGIFPNKSIGYNTGQIAGAPINEYVFTCPACGGYIVDCQQGEVVVTNPDALGGNVRSFLLPRTISPKITARKMFEDYSHAKTGDQKKSYHNRTLARPYIDPDQIPVTLAHCEAAAREGMRMGLLWERSGRDTYMGIDQMGGLFAVLIKRRMPDGRQAVIHVEAVFVTPTVADPDASPWKRAVELMGIYGVKMCVVEQLPDVNAARSFANKFPRRVFLATYTDMKDDYMVWGDDLTKADRRTVEEDRTRYMVTLNQYKCMQASLYRVRDGGCLFPNPDDLIQDVIESGVTKRIPILRDWVFNHFTKTALVVEQPEDAVAGGKKNRHISARRTRTKVAKIGLDPHFSFTNMLCDVAWARSHGTSTFLLPDENPMAPPSSSTASSIIEQVTFAPVQTAAMRAMVCGTCKSMVDGRCVARNFFVMATDPKCDMYQGL